MTVPERRRVRKKHMLIVGGAVSVVYWLNAAVVLMAMDASADPLMANEMAMRCTFHGLLVLATTGLYVASRNRVWYIVAWLYLVATSTNAAGSAIVSLRGHNATHDATALFVGIVLIGEVLLNVLFLAIWYRYRLLSEITDDDHLPTSPWGAYSGIGCATYGTIVVSFMLRSCDTLWAALHSEFAFAQYSTFAWVMGGVASITAAGHLAVTASLGLFYVIRARPRKDNLPAAGLAYLLVTTGSLFADAFSVGHTSTLSNIATLCEGISVFLVVVSLASEKREGNVTEEIELEEVDDIHEAVRTETERLTKTARRVLEGCALVHMLAWYCECIALVCAAPMGSLLGEGIAAGIGGAHGAVLYGVQTLNIHYLSNLGRATIAHERLRRHSFHFVTSIFYVCIAAAAVVGSLRTLIFDASNRWQTVLLLCSALCRMCTQLLAIWCVTWIRGDTWRFETIEEARQNLSQREVVNEGVVEVAAEMKRLQMAAGGLVGVVVLLVYVMIAGLGGEVEAMYPVVGGHSAGHALAFHFSFLYAIHALVAALNYRRVSLSLVLAGSPFILTLLVIVIVKQSTHDLLPLAVLSPLSLAIASVAVLLYRIKIKANQHPAIFTSGNVDWQMWEPSY